MGKSIAALALFALATGQATAQAPVCKYVDGNGNTVFSALPPEPGHKLVSCMGADEPRKTDLSRRDAFDRVKIGMTQDEVRKLGQVGNRCTDWPHQRPPVCGPLHYFSDMRTVETATGTTTSYSYGRDEIVYRNGTVVLIRR
jgi:hypothetical protein